MNGTYKIRSVGGALVVTIPQYVARAVGLSAGDYVTFNATASDILMRKQKQPAATKPGPKGSRK